MIESFHEWNCDFFATAKEYLNTNTENKQVKLYLLSHSLKAGFKARLHILNGFSIEELRRKDVGHGLLELLEMRCLDNSFTISPNDERMVYVVNKYYKSKQLEYFPEKSNILAYHTPSYEY